jgi:hypothetical protein
LLPDIVFNKSLRACFAARLAIRLAPTELALLTTTLATDSCFATIVGNRNAQPGRLATGRADQQHVRCIDRHFLAEPTTLRVLLASLDVSIDPIHTLDNKFATRGVY